MEFLAVGVRVSVLRVKPLGVESRKPGRPVVSRLEAVERAEAYARAHASTPVPVSTLCHIVGLSERGLRNAFYGVRGVSPKRCMLVGRLQLVRRALIDTPHRPGAVTDVALRYGFHELGRFAGSYKQAFGETPSETLQSVGRKQVRGTAAGA